MPAGMNLENTMLRKEARHKDHILYESVYRRCPETGKLYRQKAD